MSRFQYPVSMDQWRKTPIQRGINPLTNLVEGDDSGYRQMTTLQINSSPLVVPVVEVRASYDGMNEFGVFHPEIALAGGFSDGKLVLRETAARAIEYLDDLVRQASDNQFKLVALDGFRSGARQSAGFTRLLREQMKVIGLTVNGVSDRIADFIAAGNIADGTFSWVNLIRSPGFAAAVKRLKANSVFMEQITDFAAKSSQEHFSEQDIDEAILTYLTISANSGIGEGGGLELNFECNAHAGGGACDVFVVEVKSGRPINIVPFDYAGDEAGMDFMEREGSYQAYLKAAAEKPELQKHLEKLGYRTPEFFQPSDWSYFQSANRLLYHAAKAIGCTYYSGDVGGENWHLEPGNMVYDPATGDLVACERLTASAYPDSGNPGHTLQKIGKDAIAVWGGKSAHVLARDLGLK